MKKNLKKPLPPPPHNTERSIAAVSKVTKIPTSGSDSAGMDSVSTKNGDYREGGSVGQGDVLANRFELLDILGLGGINTVYKALDKHRSKTSGKKQYVTIKVLKKQYQSSEDWIVALTRAARKSKSLNHPNIAKTHRFQRDGAAAYLLMEYLSGESLGQKISPGHAGVMPVRQALWIINEIGHALTYAHARGVVHNDLKPANVFLTNSGEVKVIDFGIAHALRKTAKDNEDAPHFGPDNYSVSSPSYASPELLDLKESDPRDDVYALACIAYELLAGRHPFGRVRATGARDYGLELRPSEAFTINQWGSLQRALAFNREERTPTVRGFLTGLNTSVNWTRRISVAAGVMACAFGVSLFFGKSQAPTIDWPTEPEVAIKPTLPEPDDTNPFESPRDPTLQPSAEVEPIAAVHIPTQEQKVPEQVELAYDKFQTIDGLTRMSEQKARTYEQSTPTQGEQLSHPGPREKIVQATTEPQYRAESKSERQAIKYSPKIASTSKSLSQPAGKDKITRIVGVRHELIPSESPVATIQARIIGPVSKAEVSIDRGNGFVPYRLYDDGTHGDQKPGDKEFYAAVTLGHNQQDTRYYVTAYTEKGAALSNPINAEKEAYLLKLPHGISRPSVVINEFMASNDQTIADSQGGYDDWIELYNMTPQTIDLSGLYLSDNPTNLKQWRFPNGTLISAYSYLLVWADRSSTYTDMTSQPPELHTNFELSRRAEHILLVDSDKKNNSIIDRVSYSRQRQDRSMGRYPNGFGKFGITQAPTPGMAN